MRLSTIRYIVKVAETGSFTRAAAELFVSQPALSQSIQRFEQDIGMPVFVREKGQLRLTEAGRIMVEEGRGMLDDEKRTYARLEALKDRKPHTVRIGAAPTYQRYYLTDTLARLQTLFPNIHIHILEGFSHGMSRMVENGEMEVALAVEPFSDRVIAEPIAQEEIFLAVPPGSALIEKFPRQPDSGSAYPVADLRICRDEPFIMYPEDRRIQRIVVSETQRAGFAPRGAITGYSTEAANAMAFQGIGLAFVPAVTAMLCAPANRPVYYRLREGGLFRTLGLISLDNPELKAFEAALARLLREKNPTEWVK